MAGGLTRMDTPITNVGTRVDLAVQVGADFLMTVSFTTAEGLAVDLTGSVIAAQIRRHALDTNIIATFGVAIDPAGSASLTLDHSLDLPCGENPTDAQSRFVWDLKWTDSTGNVSTPVGGAVTVNRAVTR